MRATFVQRIRKSANRIYVEETIISWKVLKFSRSLLTNTRKKHDFFVASVLDGGALWLTLGLTFLESWIHGYCFRISRSCSQGAESVPEAPSQKGGRSSDPRDEIALPLTVRMPRTWRRSTHQGFENGNIEFGVHIADVSYYVTEGSCLIRKLLTARLLSTAARPCGTNGTTVKWHLLAQSSVDRLTQSAIMK